MSQKQLRTLILVFGLLSAGGFLSGGVLMIRDHSGIGSLAVLGGLAGVAIALVAEIVTALVFRRLRIRRESQWVRYFQSTSSQHAASGTPERRNPPNDR